MFSVQDKIKVELFNFNIMAFKKATTTIILIIKIFKGQQEPFLINIKNMCVFCLKNLKIISKAGIKVRNNLCGGQIRNK